MLSFAQTALTYIVPTLFVLTLIVTVHEFGHFLVARWLGVAVDEFSIGFGRPLLSWRDRFGVEWRLGWIPLGGYVRFAGDDNAASVPDGNSLAEMRHRIVAEEGLQAVNKYYHFKPIWARAAIAAAGPAANFLLAIVIFSTILMVIGRPTPPARIGQLQPGSPAYSAGFQSGDLVVEAAGTAVANFDDLQKVVEPRAGVPTVFSVERGAKRIDLTATPNRGQLTDELGRRHEGGILGIYSGYTAADLTLHRRGPVEALEGGVGMTWDVLDTTIQTIGGIVTGQISPRELGGPLGIAQASHAVAMAGAEGAKGFGEQLLGSFTSLLGLCAVISVGIGFMNLLPIPILDGGHLLFYAYEAAARRPLDAAVQAVGYRVGLALLLGLMLFATTNDLQRGSVFHFLRGLFS